MSFIADKIVMDGLTYDDVLLIPAYSEVLPKTVELTTKFSRNIELKVPFVTAAMDTVTEAKMAIAIAREGGIGVIHKNMSIEEQARQVAIVKRAENGMIYDPVTIKRGSTVRDALALMSEYRIGGIPVVDDERYLVGIVTNRDLRFEKDMDKRIDEVMTKENIVTTNQSTDMEAASRILQEHKIEKLPVVDKEGKLVGLITYKDITKAKDKPMACKDAKGRLRVAAGVGVTADTLDRMQALVDAGADAIVIDTAHGHSMYVIEKLKEAKKRFPNIDIVVGNIATGEAAKALVEAGADAVEIHMAHGYLVNSFMSPRTNKRVDEFGGSFENRMRFSTLIIDEVKKATQGKIAVLARINSTEDMFGGLDNHDMCAIATYLESCGLDALHVSRAVHLKDEYMWAPTGIHGGFSAEYVANIKKCVSIPVITVGRYTEPQFAEVMVRTGNADLVAFGRQSLADPAMPKKAFEDRLEDMTPCIACLQGCVANMYAGKPICCLTNPVLGRESEGMKEAETKKKIYVIGGGPAGMCAAFTAARRGHDVTLFEASDVLGGNMRLAAYPPGKGDITNMIRSYITKCEKAGVKIVLNTEVTADLIKKDAPDAVIVATGSETLVLPFIKGITAPEIVHGGDCLSGKRPVGHKVLVVGGGMVGAETAEFLAEKGHDVSIIEMRDAIGPDVIHEHRVFLMEGLKEYDVHQYVNAAVSEIYPDGVSYKNAADKSDDTVYELRGFDTVVLSMGYVSKYTHREGQEVVYDFVDELKAICPEVHVVGDAIRARRALDATKEAYDVALNI